MHGSSFCAIQSEWACETGFVYCKFSIMRVSAEEELEQCARETRINEDTYISVFGMSSRNAREEVSLRTRDAHDYGR